MLQGGLHHANHVLPTVLNKSLPLQEFLSESEVQSRAEVTGRTRVFHNQAGTAFSVSWSGHAWSGRLCRLSAVSGGTASYRGMSRPANAEGYPGPAWLWNTLVRPLTSALDCIYSGFRRRGLRSCLPTCAAAESLVMTAAAGRCSQRHRRR